MSGLDPRDDDLVQPFLIDESGLRGRLIRLGPAVDEILRRHDYPEPVAMLLGEALALTAALAAALRFNGIFTLQTKGDGPVRLLVVDVNDEGGLRGYAELRGPIPTDVGDAPVPRLLGSGYLAFTVDQGPDTERYQGIVELIGPTLADCIQHYFQQSQQFAAGVKLAAGRDFGGAWRAGALMVQRLPQNEQVPEDDEAEDAWRRAVILVGHCTQAELLDPVLTPHRLLYRLFHEDGVRVFPTQKLLPVCRCSRERALGALGLLSAEELEECKVDGRITVACQFCNRDQVFEDADLAGLRGGAAPATS
ncbi:MAG: Hsp33 family molecular chaperone HslO [Alphaproteobacteria bacterium]